MALLEAKKIASQYQKEVDKCSSGMETCEEAREKGRDENIVVGASYLFRVWVAQRPPGYAFVDFDDSRDAKDAIRELDAVTDNYKQENITTFPLRSLYCLIIRTFSFCSSSRNKVADPQAIKVASRGNGPQFLITELKFMLNQQSRYDCFFVQACVE
ncbi:hypothetical protein DVH24_025204 [Malus domestica]|uniref:RRM domain-containing protein n=1 Tax=Malus domestica TaxID=3750 RepID=A0A498HS65_MALDO|nr:hypothetical protein DVH24_025204 [Malus domestica]